MKMKLQSWFISSYLILLIVGASVWSHPAHAYILNGPLVLFGDVRGFEISSDSKYVVYRSDQDIDEVYEIFSVPITGGTPVKLNPPLASNESIADWRISPNGNWVVYRLFSSGSSELYSVPVAGGIVANKISGPLVLGGSVTKWEISPDSNRVAFFATKLDENKNELFSVPIAGGTVLKLNDQLDTDRDVVGDIVISPDSQKVIYRADRDGDNLYEIFSISLIPAAGELSVKLNLELFSSGRIGLLLISPDSSLVAYLAKTSSSAAENLNIVPIGGGDSLRLASPGSSSDTEFKRLQFSPDSSKLVYLRGPSTLTAPGQTLFSVSTTGGTPVNLSATLLGPLSVRVFRYFLIDSDSQRVIFLASYGFNLDQNILFVNSIDGGTPISLSGTIVEGGTVSRDFALTNDNTRVLFRADKEEAGKIELFSAGLDSSFIDKVNSDLVDEGTVGFVGSLDVFAVNPGDKQVVYIASALRPFVNELFLAPISGGDSVKLHEDFGDSSAVDEFSVSPDGNYVVYRADQNEFGKDELFAVDISQYNKSSELCWPIKSEQGIAVVCL